MLPSTAERSNTVRFRDLTASLRRAAAIIVLAVLLVAPHTFFVTTGPLGTGSLVMFFFTLAWTPLFIWSIVDDLPRLEKRWTTRPQLPWWLGVAAGVVALLVRWAYVSSPRLLLSPTTGVHYLVVVESGFAAGLISLLVLTSRAVGRPIEVGRVPLHRWVAGTALAMDHLATFAQFLKFNLSILFAIATCIMWVRDLPSFEGTAPGRKWRVRVGAVLIGATLFAVNVAWRESMFDANGWVARLQTNIGSEAYILVVVEPFLTLLYAGVGLAFVTVCLAAADGTAYALRRSKSVRLRMLVLGLACAALAFVLARVQFPIYNVQPLGKPELLVAPTYLFKIVLLACMVAAFSSTLSKGLSRSLEQSVRAISEIRRGNLDVVLDDSGRDEVAEVARSFNQMVAMLREAEFLEKINDDLRSRSTQLTQTLEALRHAQADLVRSERMASVATLVKGIAHELNNPINYIAGNMTPLRRYCDFLGRVAATLSDGQARTTDEVRAVTLLTTGKDLQYVSHDLARLTSDIGEGARRAQLIITDLQNLTSATQRGIERVDLHRVVQQTISLLGPRVPKGVKLDAELTQVSSFPARAGQIEQVLVNLTDNALRAVGDNGTVRLYVGTDSDRAVIRVTDDGAGMTEEVKERAFEPFFTTRSAGEGSGLGLAIVASIVRGHRGTFALHSEPGKGTQVELFLPVDGDVITQAEM